jgi:hypothetical protein
LTLDGVEVEGSVIQLVDDRQEHLVQIGAAGLEAEGQLL